MVTKNAANNATGISGTLLQGQGVGTASAFSTSTYPATNAINTLLYASSANVMAALATANNAVLATSTSGVPSISTTPRVTSITFDGTNALGNFVVSTAWTPVLAFGGASVGITYATQQGLYSRIGPIVYFSLQIVLTSKGSSTGNATITGLPLTISASDTGIFALSADQLTYVGNWTIAQLSSGSGFRLFNNKTASNIAVLDNAAFANNTSITINGTYSV